MNMQLYFIIATLSFHEKSSHRICVLKYVPLDSEYTHGFGVKSDGGTKLCAAYARSWID